MFVESKHSLHVLKHVIKTPRSKTPLEVSLVSAVGLLVGPGLVFKVSPVSGVSVLAVDVKILKHVVKVEAESLVRIGSHSAPRLPGEVGSITKLIVLSPPGLI